MLYATENNMVCRVKSHNVCTIYKASQNKDTYNVTETKIGAHFRNRWMLISLI